MSEKKKEEKKGLRLAIAVAVLIGAIIMLIAVERASRAHKTSPPPEAPTTGSTTTPPNPSAASPSAPGAPALPIVVEPGPTPSRAFFASPSAPPPSEERSALADELHSPATHARQDLVIVASLFTTYADHLRELPVGNNAEITAALAGDNARGLAVIPADHAAINAQGELTDRWGTTYFFHQLGGGVMQIRSAGPDRRAYTDDDLLFPPPEPPAADFVP